jgi:hypothetical protein
MDFDHVKAERFYKDDGDKIKLNWFCYEYANNLYMAIRKSSKLPQYRACHSKPEISSFCVYFSKRLRKSIYDMQTGQAKAVVFSGDYVDEFYPKSPFELRKSLLGAATDAWKQQMLGCNGCPTRCLADGFEICGMFDTLERTGWPT